jgi:spermidine/putrescine transport system substrate-binding protein
MAHPRDRYGRRGAVDRRAFLKRSALASAGVAGASLLSACSSVEAPGPSGGSAVDLARPHRPVRLPIYDDDGPIADDLAPEKEGPLRLFNWEEYIWPRVVDEFSERFDTKVEITTFANMDDALATLRRGGNDFDVFFHRVDVLGRLVADKLLRPLNHNYLPSLERHVWHVYRNPFYDEGARYTVPYTVYTTGIAWRVDHVTEDIAAMENPYDIFWNKRYRNKLRLMNDYREVVAMALLRRGHTNLNTGDARTLATAREDLIEVAELLGGLSIDAYTEIPHNVSWIHQAYSGDMVASPFYFPKGSDPSVVRYWTPPNGRGAVGNDVISLLRGGKNPVLAHHFLNYILDFKTSMKNFGWNGYQPPQRRADPDRLVDEGYVQPYLKETITRPSDFNRGFMELELSPRADRRWHDAWEGVAAAPRGGADRVRHRRRGPHHPRARGGRLPRRRQGFQVRRERRRPHDRLGAGQVPPRHRRPVQGWERYQDRSGAVE